ncbi:MAG: sulfurtransferase TusA family protein [Deltaproteobacteria bacterium]|nr:sulfurtransferase TusA family protein [Deltaproteobacteria bacterium]
MKVVDARGLSCPQPVVLTKKSLEEGELPFVVFVDTDASKENVTRFVRSRSLSCTVQENADGSANITVGK